MFIGWGGGMLKMCLVHYNGVESFWTEIEFLKVKKVWPGLYIWGLGVPVAKSPVPCKFGSVEEMAWSWCPVLFFWSLPLTMPYLLLPKITAGYSYSPHTYPHHAYSNISCHAHHTTIASQFSTSSATSVSHWGVTHSLQDHRLTSTNKYVPKTKERFFHTTGPLPCITISYELLMQILHYSPSI